MANKYFSRFNREMTLEEQTGAVQRLIDTIARSRADKTNVFSVRIASFLVDLYVTKKYITEAEYNRYEAEANKGPNEAMRIIKEILELPTIKDLIKTDGEFRGIVAYLLADLNELIDFAALVKGSQLIRGMIEQSRIQILRTKKEELLNKLRRLKEAPADGSNGGLEN